MKEQKLSCNCYSWTEDSQGPLKFLHFHKIFHMSIFLRCQKTRYLLSGMYLSQLTTWDRNESQMEDSSIRWLIFSVTMLKSFIYGLVLWWN